MVDSTFIYYNIKLIYSYEIYNEKHVLFPCSFFAMTFRLNSQLATQTFYVIDTTFETCCMVTNVTAHT